MQEGNRDVTTKDLDTMKSLLENNIPSVLGSEWLAVVNGCRLSSDAVKSLRQSVMVDKHSDGNINGTTAEKFFYKLSTTDGVEYTCLTGSYDEALETVRVTKTRKSKRNGKVMENLNDVEKEAADQVKNVVQGLGLGNGEFMLAVAWVTEESRLNHKKYPELLGSDETFRTNAEKRPLTFLVGEIYISIYYNL